MSFADHLDESHAGHVVSQGLLGTKAQWLMPLGVAQAAPLRWAARALIALAVALFLAWSGSLLVQLGSGRGAAPWLGLAIAAVVGGPWLVMASRLWRGLAQVVFVPLRWGGLPPSRPTERSSDAPAGWSLPGWPHPMSVHVVFDLGLWVLVKMVSMGPGAHPQAWFWVDARVGLRGTSGHHLRALLFCAKANEVGNDQAAQAGEPRVMASSGDIQRQWSNLLSSFKTIGQGAGNGANQREAGAQGVAMSDSDFAKTLILEFPHRAVSRGVRS